MKNQPSAITGIDHIQIAGPAGCEAEARRFFGQVLGLEEIDKPEPLGVRGGCWFKVGSRQLHIGVEKDFRPSLKAHPAFAVENVGDLFAVLSRAGIRCTKDESLPGIHRFYAEDPWGNRLEFTQPTHSARKDKDEDIAVHLRQLEENLLQPGIRHNAQAVSDLLADDFCEFGSSGRIFNKQQIINALQSEVTPRIRMTDVQVKRLGCDSVLLTYKTIQHDPESPEVIGSLRSSLWGRRDGSWKMLFHQGTKI